VDIQRTAHIPVGVRFAHVAARCLVALAAIGLTAWSAILVKERTVRTPLVQAESRLVTDAAPVIIDPVLIDRRAAANKAAPTADEQIERILASARPVEPGTVRWFDGRRVVPVRTIWMKVTAYSPDARSCGKWADGQTATLHSVWTNAMRLVAADTRVLPYGSIITVPGYADSEVVPVLDCGGAIKGNRLDVLFPTHEIARKWGVRDLPVTIWAYEDETEG
jgi:3D (Asp-Asp-Asp) domain-containing protein